MVRRGTTGHGLRSSMRALSWLLVLAGCAVEDGGACVEDDDCESEICAGGYCGGSDCREAGDHSDCEPGWECTYIPPSVLDDIGAAIGGLFGGDGEADGDNVCRATCGSCPPNYHCGTRTEGLCEYGAPVPTLTLAAPPDTARGASALIEASVTLEAGSIVRHRWTIEQLDASSETIETMGPVLEHRFEAQGSYDIGLTVYADNGTEASASARLYVRGVAGDDCYETSHCASGLGCDEGVCQ